MVLSTLARLKMPPPSPSFEKLCKSMNIPVPSRNDRLPFLATAAVPSPIPPTSAALNERCAALAWARHAVMSGVDPDTWSSSVDASLLPRLLALYTLPPARPSDGQISDLARLARAVALYLPDDPVPAAPFPVSPPAPQPQPPPHSQLQQPSPLPQHPHSTPGTGFPISTVRADPPTVPPVPSPIAIPYASPPLPSAGSKRKAWMMHTELAALLPEAVYAALDSTVGLTASERYKLLSACKKNDIASLLDHATAAPFGHQFTLFCTTAPTSMKPSAASPWRPLDARHRPPRARSLPRSTSGPAMPFFFSSRTAGPTSSVPSGFPRSSVVRT